MPKTSGSGGLHVYVPMPPETPYEAGLLFAQIVATMVARKHPKAATVERSLAARGRRIYVDYLQNVKGKTLASAYSARANDFAGVSTPLTWDEVDDGVSPQDFTLRNFAERLEVGWRSLGAAAEVEGRGPARGHGAGVPRTRHKAHGSRHTSRGADAVQAWRAARLVPGALSCGRRRSVRT